MGDTSGFSEARPLISIDEVENAELKGNITAFHVEETTEGMYWCEATFGNWGGSGYLYFDRKILDFGKTIAITIGEGDAKARVFKGRISAIEAHYSKFGTPDIVILAEDRLSDMRMTRRTRTFDNMSDSDVMRQIASGHNLTPDIDIDGATHKVLAQVNQSDLAFIRERARAVNAEIWVEDTIFM
ncbi:Phage late control gene D protein (GPD) [uncultured archaeon]|nr:Phage late control gene D protein (GPD) [uncultured archaeon]